VSVIHTSASLPTVRSFFRSFYCHPLIPIPRFTVNLPLYSPLHREVSISFQDLLHRVLLYVREPFSPFSPLTFC